MSSTSFDWMALCDQLSAAIWPPFIFGLVIGLPSAVLYFGQICIILGHWKHFGSSYFVIFALRGGISLANYFCSYIAHRLDRLGVSLMDYVPGWVMGLGTFVMYYSFHLENLTTALLLLNRFSSVQFPMRYERIWRQYLLYALLIIILLPLPFTITIFWLQWVAELDIVRTPYAGNNFSFTLNNNVPKDYPFPIKWSFTTTCAYSAAIFLAVSLVLNLATIWAFMKKSSQANGENANGTTNKKSQQQLQKQKMERKLTIYTLATFGGQILLAAYMSSLALRYVVPDHDKQSRIYLAIFNQYGWVTDLCTIALPSWLLLWANKKSRDLLLAKLGLRKSGNGISTGLPIAALGMQSIGVQPGITDTWVTRRTSIRPTGITMDVHRHSLR